ncbi:hypothetical protein BDZ89DRAFT_1160955 [Hymenopellis radicata]|nr:hypothetical protein BDZ89DRAFT_1160955 [Hymenopellis radicata]
MKFFSAFITAVALAFAGMSAIHAAPVEGELKKLTFVFDYSARDACFSQGYTIGYTNGCGSVTRGRPGYRMRDIEDVEAREACTGAAYLAGFNAGMIDGVNACL